MADPVFPSAVRPSESDSIEVPPTATCHWVSAHGRLSTTPITAPFERITGLREDDARLDARLWLSAVHPDDRPVFERFLAALRAGTPARAEYRVVRADGAVRWMVSVGWSSPGDARCWQGMLADVTERHSRGHALEASEAKRERAEALLDRVFETVDDVVWSVERGCSHASERPRFALRALSASFERLTGVSRESTRTPRRLLSVVPASHRHALITWLRSRSGGGPHEYALVVRSPSGPRHVELRVTVEQCGEGCPEYFVGVARDVTERLAAEAELRARTRLLDALVHACPDAVGAQDAEGRLLFMNDVMEGLLGVPLAAGETVRSARLDDESLRIGREIRERARRGERVSLTHEFRLRDGGGTWLKLTAAPLVGEAGQVEGTMVFAQDVTTEREAQTELSAALETQRRLLREVHHRVKNNLQIVMSLLRLQLASIGDAAARDALAESGRRIGAMALVHESLYGHFDAENIEAERYFCSLVDGIASTFGAGARGVHVRTTVGVAELPIDLALHLGLVVNELVSNAFKHAFHERAGGAITVALACAQDAIELSVDDDGASPTENGPREGLGLQLVAGLAQQLGGALTVPAPPSKRFTVRVPMKASA